MLGPFGKIKSVILQLALLKCISKGEEYPYSLLKKVSKSNFGKFKIIKSDIYNAIASLEKKRYIKLTKMHGTKKYYKITKEGRKVLKETRKILRTTLKEISKIL
jgi:DNA-binding PadR family transcriptional regulator